MMTSSLANCIVSLDRQRERETWLRNKQVWLPQNLGA
jgi:hypothetical protein